MEAKRAARHRGALPLAGLDLRAFKYWGDEESDIKLPFALFVVAFGYMWYDMYTQLKTETPEPEALLALVRLFA